MKKTILLGAIVALLAFQYCSTAKKAQEIPKTTFAAHVHPVVQTSCSPCHVSPGGKQTALNNYANIKGAIDEVLVRIQKNPGEKGFMPFKHAKLPDSTIQVFMKWKNDGLLEK